MFGLLRRCRRCFHLHGKLSVVCSENQPECLCESSEGVPEHEGDVYAFEREEEKGMLLSFRAHEFRQRHGKHWSGRSHDRVFLLLKSASA